MGKNLKMKAARAALGLTQQDLAEAVGVTRQTIAVSYTHLHLHNFPNKHAVQVVVVPLFQKALVQ